MRDRLAVAIVCLLVLSPSLAVGTVAADGASIDGHRVADERALDGERLAEGAPYEDWQIDGEQAEETESALERSATPVAEPAATASMHAIDQSTTLHHRPDDVGTFGAVVTLSIPEPVRALSVRVPTRATIESADGFDVVDGSTLRWNGETAQPTVTLGVETNRRQRRGGHANTGDPAGEPAQQVFDAGTDLDFAETREWGIVAVPQLALDWEYERGHSISVERSVDVAGDGAVGETIVVFGPVEVYEAEAGGERHRLVVPQAADLAESPDAILQALDEASRALTLGAPNDEFFVVAAPVGEVDWRAAGLQYGDSDAWVRADAPLDDPGSVWLHEYTHSRQPFAGVGNGTTEAIRWLVEGQADYYAATLALELGYAEYDEFRRFVDRGSLYPYDQGVLSDPDTWTDPETPYARGPPALLAIDREIRRATDGDLTLQHAFRRVNVAETPLESRAFYAAVEAVGGADARATAERVVETETVPDTRTESAYRSLFDGEPTAFDHRFRDAAITVSGPYRGGQLGGLDELVPGETAAVPIAIENEDADTGYFDAALVVDGAIVDATAGSLDAGDRATGTVAWTPTEPGTYDLRVGDDRRTVTVEAAATATVSDLVVSDRSVDQGDDVTATAVVTGHPDRPSRADVHIRTPGGTVAEETVHLAPGATARVEATFTLDRDGLNQVTAGDRQALVGVGTLAGGVAEVDALAESIPTPAIAGGAVVVAALGGVLAARRHGGV
ncbi:CARDB domain-containing protein [Halovivax cerinus]|uniref:CARDB domain-containing protein n=1 Tax=Halovivax cerinus TaxID=1487865 RepID=A0ABD5NRE9_9EURY|nr:CARDB domain-containing protein [Halovivax cerinus]